MYRQRRINKIKHPILVGHPDVVAALRIKLNRFRTTFNRSKIRRHTGLAHRGDLIQVHTILTSSHRTMT